MSREAPRLPAQSVCIHPLQRHHRVFSEQLFYVEFLYYTFCLPKAGTELDLSAGSGGGHRCHLLERHLQEAYSRGKKESPETTLWLSWLQNTQLPSSREAWWASVVNVTGMSCLPRTGQCGSPGSPVVCQAIFLAVSPPFLPLLPAQRFYELPKNLFNNSLSSFSLKLARAFCCSWAGKLTKTALRANSLNSSEKMVPVAFP